MATDPLASRVGLLLRDMREQAGLKQREVAEKLDVSLLTVGRWEKGETSPKPFQQRELLMLYISKGAVVDPQVASAAGVKLPRKAGDRPAGQGAFEDPLLVTAADIERDRGLFYDGVLHAIAAFNKTQGQLIAEVQEWRRKHRETAMPPGFKLTSPVLPNGLTMAEIDADIAAVEELEDKVAEGKSSKSTSRKKRLG